MNPVAAAPVRSCPASRPCALCWTALLVAGLLWTHPALAGSYLDRAALLLAQAAQETEYLRAHLADRELARVIDKIARARLRAAQEMEIPKEVTAAHPHLLLVLEAYERAVAAVIEGQTGRFLEYQQRARDEEGILRGVLKEHGWTLPKR